MWIIYTKLIYKRVSSIGVCAQSLFVLDFYEKYFHFTEY